MNILCITPSKERILIVVRITEKSELEILKNELQDYTYAIEGNSSVGVCSVVISQGSKTKTEIHKLYTKLCFYMSDEYGEE